MASSRSARAAAVASLLLGALGCAHLGASLPRADSGSAPAQRSGAGNPPAAPSPAPPAAASPGAGAAAEGSPARLDPSEIMTAEELATIPDPLPGGGREPAPAPSSARAEDSEPRSGTSEPVTSGSSIWRVQILATPDRQLADQVAAEAAERLGTTARIDLESSLYKVRLGGFATEGDAQGLRERAIEMGYPGAFRVKGVSP